MVDLGRKHSIPTNFLSPLPNIFSLLLLLHFFFLSLSFSLQNHLNQTYYKTMFGTFCDKGWKCKISPNQNTTIEIQENIEKVHRSEISTHRQQEEEIERGCEKEREGSPVPIFPLPSFRIVRMQASWMGLFSKVSVMWVKRSWVIFKQKTEFLYIVWDVANDWFFGSWRFFYFPKCYFHDVV